MFVIAATTIIVIRSLIHINIIILTITPITIVSAATIVHHFSFISAKYVRWIINYISVLLLPSQSSLVVVIVIIVIIVALLTTLLRINISIRPIITTITTSVAPVVVAATIMEFDVTVAFALSVHLIFAQVCCHHRFNSVMLWHL